MRHACDVMLSRPRESCELILQTLLQITCQGDGFSSCWENVLKAFEALKDANDLRECVPDLLKLICGHFNMVKSDNDIYSSPIWKPLLPSISAIISTILEMEKCHHLAPEEIADQDRS